MPRNTRNRKEARTRRADLYTKIAHKQILWWAQAGPYFQTCLALGDTPTHTRNAAAIALKQYRAMPLHRQWAERKLLLGIFDYIVDNRTVITPGYSYFGRNDNTVQNIKFIPANKGDIRLTFGEIPS